MISQIIQQHLNKALARAERNLHWHWILRNRGEVNYTHRKWLINETPKFYLQLHGATDLQYPGGHLRVQKNEVLLMAPHIPHKETKLNEPDDYTALVINFRSGKMQLIISGRKDLPQWVPIHDRDYVDNSFRPAALELLRLLTLEGESLPPQARRQMLQTFLEIARNGYREQSERQPSYPQLVADALQSIDDNIADSSLTVSQLARQLGCSSEHLSREFSRHTEHSLKETITTQRLKLAAEILLSQPAATVSAVAYMSGFSSPGYFCTCFRKHFGNTPASYRRSAPI